MNHKIFGFLKDTARDRIISVDTTLNFISKALKFSTLEISPFLKLLSNHVFCAILKISIKL